MKFLIFIGILVVIIIIHFAHDSHEQKTKVTKEGGMRNKYSTLVDYLLSIHPDAKVMNESGTAIMVGVRGASGSTTFDIVQTFGTVTIQYKVNNIVMGNHKLEWSFPEYDDQEKMIETMEHDIAAYNANVMSKFT